MILTAEQAWRITELSTIAGILENIKQAAMMGHTEIEVWDMLNRDVELLEQLGYKVEDQTISWWRQYEKDN